MSVSLPHLKNNTGIKEIFIGAKKFMCAGASDPFDHPHVYLYMGAASEKLCPYCSTLYRFDENLKTGETRPARCIL